MEAEEEVEEEEENRHACDWAWNRKLLSINSIIRMYTLLQNVMQWSIKLPVLDLENNARRRSRKLASCGYYQLYV